MKNNYKKTEYYTVGKSPLLYAGDHCNNRCIYCFESDYNFPIKSLKTIKDEIDIIRSHFDFINIMGQEPTLRKDILNIVSYAKRKNFNHVSITTNGRMFAYKNFTKSLLNTKINQMVVTIAGHNSKIHDSHTSVSGSFKQTLEGLKNIIALKDKYFSLVLNIMVTKMNFNYLQEMVDFYANIGIKEMNIGHIMPLNKMIVDSKKIIAKMSEVTPLLIKCYTKHSSGIKFLFVEYPACVFPKKYRDMAFPCLEENPEKIRLKICEKCDYKNQCAGVSGFYINLYGKKEFKL